MHELDLKQKSYELLLAGDAKSEPTTDLEKELKVLMMELKNLKLIKKEDLKEEVSNHFFFYNPSKTTIINICISAG